MKKHQIGSFLKAITLLGIAALALSACGGGGIGQRHSPVVAHDSDGRCGR